MEGMHSLRTKKISELDQQTIKMKCIRQKHFSNQWTNLYF